jgi:uncharacterized phage protein gp47/JayE
MPSFQPRNRIQILREMVARVIARSKLKKLTPNSVWFHLVSAAANEDSEQYVQMARLQALFSIDRSFGSDLDERAKDILPGTIFRRPALFAQGDVVFTRPGTVGTVVIPAGTQLAAQDAQGQIRFRTTSAASILNGNSSSGNVNVVATIAGIRGNVEAGSIVKFVTRLAGITSVTNPSRFDTGFDRESDDSFKARLKAFVQAISRGTPTALAGFAKNVILQDGRRVLFAHVVEPLLPTGIVDLYIDDGTGTIEEYDATFISSPDVFLASALGGEKDLFTTNRPIRDDGSFVLEINTGSGFVTQVRGTDYELNPALGQIELLDASYPIGLSAGDSARANYRFYTGLIQATQRIIDGDPTDPLRAPGVRAAGIQVRVKPPAAIFQSVTATISVLAGFDTAIVASAVSTAIQKYINGLDIGEDVIVSEIIERAMAVDGMFNFHLSEVTGSTPPTDQVILGTQVARITSGSISLT